MNDQINIPTRACLAPGFAIAVGLIPLFIVSEGFVRNASVRGRIVRAGVAVILSVALPLTFSWALIAPLLAEHTMKETAR